MLGLFLNKKILILLVLIAFLFNKSYSQCDSIKLSTNYKANCQPALFQWVIHNAPSGSTFKWNFGNGTQTGRDTFYAYIQTAGKYSVSVQITFPDKTVCNIIKTNLVEVYPKPIPNFYASRKKLCDGPDTITYFDITPNSAKRSWVIDGTNHNNAQKILTHTFASAGIKQLSLVVEDNNGCKAIKEFDSVAIIYKDVILDFNADKTSGCIIKSVKFTPTINSNGLKILSYKWEFPGGNPFNQYKKDPDTVRYDVIGSFSPSFEVTAENGCVHKLMKQNFMTFGAIDSINLNFSDTTVCLGGTILIKNLNNTLPGTFKWTFPGTTSIIKPNPNNCLVKYDTLGKYDVSVVYNYNGCTSAKTFKKIIRVKGVKADFTSPDYYHCLLPHTVHLMNKSFAFEPGKMVYNWAIYSNSKLLGSSNSFNDSFIVNQTGYYDVVLITSHSNGCKDTFRQQNYIRNYKILPAFDANYKIGCINQLIQFDQATPPSSYMAPDKFKWTFYDKDTSKILGRSNLPAPKFAYPDTGLYTVKMVADNGIGCKDSITKLQFIEIVNPKIAFEISNAIICKNEILIGKGKSEPQRARFSYFWYLTHNIDSNTVYNKTAEFKEKITKAGEYNLKFVHEINKGCRDSIIKNDLVKINGITVQMMPDTFNGCVPLTVRPKVNLTENFHFINTSNTVKYRWWASPSINVVIKNDTTSSPEFNFNIRGEYTINLEVTNSDGCTHSVSSEIIYVGVKADFNINDNIVCAGQDVILTDKSTLFSTKIKWILNSGTFSNDANDKSIITIHYKDDAIHTIGLIANKLDYCYDTVYKTIKSIVVKAEMVAIERVLKCAPVYAQFISNSKYADSLKWDFGDGNGVITTDANVGHIYRTNTGLIKGFTNSLIAKSNEGCSDTLIKTNYIKVLGPAPSFDLINNEGCEPLDVKFINKSCDVFKHYLNYDNGSPLDTVFRNYIYFITGQGLQVQEYQPRMYAIDSLGCKAEFISPEKVIVKKNPIAKFIISDSMICENKTVIYTDKADSITNSDFYLSQIGNTPLQLSSTNITIDKYGTYQLIQIVKNSNNCFDTAHNTIIVFPTPKADFILNDTLCQLKVINITNTTSSKYPITNYKWEVYNPSNPQIFNSANIKYSFANFGPATINLTVIDTNQCQSTKSINLLVPNPTDIPTGDLKLVSVNFDSSIQILSKPTNYDRYLFGNFYNTSTSEIIKTITSKGEEVFDYYKKNISQSSVCFDLRTTDVCGYESGEGQKHCTILLKVVSNKVFTNQLNWTPYIGWPSIDQYLIYRKKQGETDYSLLATLAPQITSYLDSGLCNLNYTYFIKAFFNNLNSKSNTATNFPKFVFPPSFKDIKNVSVVENNQIEIKWLPTNNLNFRDFKIIRTEVKSAKQKISYLNTNYFMDKDVNTSYDNYIYQVSESDKCGNQSQPLYEGKSILLNVSNNDYKSLVSWNTYKTWESGVKKYNVQIENERVFKTIYSTSKIDSSYFHDQTLEKINGPYCYRIMAVSGDEKDTSLSNISCIISPSKLFFPNAFSPNGDGINDKISVRSLFVYDHTLLNGRNFKLEIFNRWGERVYLSFSIEDEWDGLYKGAVVQSGVYIYQLKVMGVDNRSYSMKGTITIVE